MGARAFWLCVSGFCSVLLAQTVVTSSSGGRLTGSVRDDTGAAASGTTLRLVRQFQPGQPSGPNDNFAFSTETTRTGDYSFAMVPPGRYAVCVETTGSGYMNPCQSGLGLAVIDLTPGASITRHLTLRRGFWLAVEVIDPAGLLDEHEQKKTPAADLLIGVSSPSGAFRPAALRRKAGGKREFSVLVPRGQTVKLVVQSRFFRVTDERGVAAGRDAGQRQDVFVAVDARAEDVPVRTVRIAGLH